MVKHFSWNGFIMPHPRELNLQLKNAFQLHRHLSFLLFSEANIFFPFFMLDHIILCSLLCLFHTLLLFNNWQYNLKPVFCHLSLVSSRDIFNCNPLRFSVFCNFLLWLLLPLCSRIFDCLFFILLRLGCLRQFFNSLVLKKNRWDLN